MKELLGRYYRNGDVRRRMTEFLGGRTLRSATAAYITANDGYSDFGEYAPATSLPAFLEEGLDIERSLWDSEALIVDIDLDYEHFDQPVVAYQEPERIFALHQPLLAAISQVLASAGVHPLVLVSGRGLHLVWKVSRSSEAFRRLAQLGRVPLDLSREYAHQQSPRGARLSAELALAFAGLGMIVEYVAHRAFAAAAPNLSIPLQITSIEVGPGSLGREILSIDLTEYGDALHTRHIRLPFGAYLKPRKLEWALGEDGVRDLLPLFEIPLSGMSLPEAIAIRSQPKEVIRLAAQVTTSIPDQADGTLALIEDYEKSELADFHRSFYEISETEAQQAAQELEKTSTTAVPLCTQWVLDHPNDWLLRPAILQHVTRVLVAVGWHPRVIAELIRNRYELDYGWGEFWTTHNASWRALFYTRIFSGLIATGLDSLVDFNCVSQREKGQCMIADCSQNLAVYRDLILTRRQHERLVGRHFNRMFLADEHL